MSQPSGRLEYPLEGFSLSWDGDGLIVQVTDYHAEKLRLPWETVLDLARRAGDSGASLASDGTTTDKS